MIGGNPYPYGLLPSPRVRALEEALREAMELILKRHVMEPRHSREDHECPECDALALWKRILP